MLTPGHSHPSFGHLTLLALALAVVASAGACTFDDTGLATKTGCRSDGDCLTGRICACQECVLPRFVPASCGVVQQDAGNNGANNGQDDVGDDGAGNNGQGDAANNGQDDGGANNGAADTDTPDASDDVPDAEACGGQPTNACGGCAILEAQPGAQCGDCPAGHQVCDGPDHVVCEGGELNACGGCVALDDAPGDDCGVCGAGVWTCEEAVLTCVGPGLNACGGCEALPHDLGASCGVCSQGQWICGADAETLVCTVPDASNRCGGCATLAMQPGDSCGVCGTGVAACASADEVACEGGGLNACGGCGFIAETIGGACGCGEEVWTCDGADASGCPDNAATSDSPTDLGTMNPNDDGRSTTGVLHDAADEDWYTLRAEERLTNIQPDVELSAPVDFGLCLYYTWDHHTDSPNCLRGTASAFGDLHGCCTDSESGTDRVEMDVDVAFRDDTGRLYLRVFSARGASSCSPFTLEYEL